MVLLTGRGSCVNLPWPSQAKLVRVLLVAMMFKLTSN